MSYTSNATLNDLALVAGLPPLPAGRIVASLKLTSTAASNPNGAIVFHYQDPLNYRFVALRPGKIVIGQKGTVGGATFTNVSRHWNPSVLKWRRVQVDIHPPGLVEVRIDGPLVHSATFPPATGGAGLWANKARAFFDDLRIDDTTVLHSP